jgi:bifunctional non-homologous end joining protein LigD
MENLHSNEAPVAISLYCTEGSSDKAYQASLSKEGAGWVVNFAYGKRGTALKTGSKTTSPVDFAQAKSIYEKLVKEKTSKGYTEDENGVAYTNTAHEHRVSGILPQLPMPAAATEVDSLILDDGWYAQEKHDGENRTLIFSGGTVVGVNRKGLVVDTPARWLKWAEIFGSDSRIVLSGEAVGDSFYAFDLLEYKSIDLRGKGFGDRYKSLINTLAFFLQLDTKHADSLKGFHIVKATNNAMIKRGMLSVLEAQGKEGVVFKRADAEFVPGKSRAQLKHKFVESATCIVLAQNVQRSVSVGLLDGSEMVPLGNVTIPANFDVPAVGATVEIRYLYRFENGALEQPVMLGLRNDIDVSDCVLSQITRIKSKTDAN